MSKLWTLGNWSIPWAASPLGCQQTVDSVSMSESQLIHEIMEEISDYDDYQRLHILSDIVSCNNNDNVYESIELLPKYDSLRHENSLNTKNQTKSLNSSYCYDYLLNVGILLLLCVTSIFFIYAYKSISIFHYSQQISSQSMKRNEYAFNFTLVRYGYDPLDTFMNRYNMNDDVSFLQYSFLQDHLGVIEPSSDMNLFIMSNYDNENITYKYSICLVDDTNCLYEDILFSDDNLINIDCTVNELYTITVTQEIKIQSSYYLLNTIKGSVMCLYVRREIRSLSDIDLARTMDAMYTLWNVSEDTGRQLYGENYHSSSYIVKLHYFNAALQESDHIHEGNGFLTQHIKLSNIFELSMQSVDSSVTLPYWDFTIEGATGLKLWESPIFSEDMFGSLRQAKDDFYGWTYKHDDILDAIIPDGRWSNLKADLNLEYSSLNYAYGYLRGLFIK